MMREEAQLVTATAEMLKAFPVGQREAMLAFVTASFRAALAEARADLSSRAIAARVEEHIDAVRELLR